MQHLSRDQHYQAPFQVPWPEPLSYCYSLVAFGKPMQFHATAEQFAEQQQTELIIRGIWLFSGIS